MIRGEVWLAKLDPVVGTEISETRPCLIVSPPEFNARLEQVIIVPLSTNPKMTPFRVRSAFGGVQGVFRLDQVRTVSKLRLVARRGRVEDAALARVVERLREMFTT